MDENKKAEETAAEQAAAMQEEEASASAAEKKEEKKDKKADKKYKEELAKAEEECKKLKEALAEEKDKYLRLAAEYDNYRRRSQKEKDGIYADAVADTVKAFLPFFDNLERAGQYTEGDKVAEGLALMAKDTESLLAKLGIEKFGVKGESFDAAWHNAVMHEEDEAYGENEIIEVFQQGYRRGDKVIRFAVVKVAN
ncbi:MAG: nucleotide exchange factor GrpE [Clostridia bacterium]|nr:nucleotide exchange factor GrpE [Clostridia bacterium]